MSEVILHKTNDQVNIELIIDRCEEPKGIIVVWPCTMGDVRMYRVPQDHFNKKGYSSILFNPRGHGNSGGLFDIRECINDLESFIYKFNTKKLPLISVGHSGGCGGLLDIGMRQTTKKYFLIAPVLDSRKSLFYMYKNSSIHEFNMMLAVKSLDKNFVLSTLESDWWLDPDVWKSNKLRKKLDDVSGNKIGHFLEKLFIQGISGYNNLKFQKNSVELILPSEDNWYPLNSTIDFAQKHDIPIIENLGKDHYFTKSWKNVWEHISNKI